MIDREQWNGRTVTFADFNLKTGRLVTDAFQRDAQEGTFAMLVHSLRYADDGTPVFSSVDEVFEQPFRHARAAGLPRRPSARSRTALRADDPDAEVATTRSRTATPRARPPALPTDARAGLPASARFGAAHDGRPARSGA